MRILSCVVGVLSSVLPATPFAQTVQQESPTRAVVQRLFDAMRASDTAATRAAFAGNARVIPIQPGAAAATSGQGLSVDQFVAFVGKNPAGNWIERMWSPSERVSGALADLWFEYDVYHGDKFDHCGVNAVQLQQTVIGWRIVSMAFTSATDGCAVHASVRPNGMR